MDHFGLHPGHLAGDGACGEASRKDQHGADDGFEVSLSFSDSEDDYLVRFDAWHDHFDDREEALDWFAFGFSQECRLKIVAKGEPPFRWVVEALADDGSWASASTKATLPLIFWRRSTTDHRQNRPRGSPDSIQPNTKSTPSGAPARPRLRL